MFRKTLPVLAAATVMMSYSAFADQSFPSGKGEITFLQMDLEDGESVDAFANTDQRNSAVFVENKTMLVRFYGTGVCTKVFVLTSKNNSRFYKACDNGVFEKL